MTDNFSLLVERIESDLEYAQEWKPTYGDTDEDITKNDARIVALEDLLSYAKDIALVTNKSDTVTISKDEYFRLLVADAKMDLLEAGGVDNWEWYGESLNPDGEESFDEVEAQIKTKVYG